MRILKDENMKLPVKMWLDDVEESAMRQIVNLSNLPFAYHHIAIMPDCHTGYGMPIGGVLATLGAVIPNAVGVDIGCGMCAVKTSIKDISIVQVKEILGEIRKLIPVGKLHHKESQNIEDLPKPYAFNIVKDSIVDKEFISSTYQIGTMGGNNHFIELQKDSDSFVWVMIHSGSRNLGFKVGNYYNKLAKEVNIKHYSSIPKDFDLAFFPLGTKEAKDYINEMEYCVDFAMRNRFLMMKIIMGVLQEKFNKSGGEILSDYKFEAPKDNGIINVCHNYARIENHFGKNVLVHRKGAISARKGEIGIIPGDQGSNSYIVRGKGNPDSFMSCSHGAGRAMSKTDAREKLDLETEKKKLDNRGIVHSIRNNQDLNEAPGGYKDISVVMNNQKDLVEIIVELTPLGVIKG